MRNPNRRGVYILATGIVAALAIARVWILTHSGPGVERLGAVANLPGRTMGMAEAMGSAPLSHVVLRGARLYWIELDSAKGQVVLRAQPLDSGSPSVIHREPLQGATVRLLDVTGAGAYCLFERRVPRPASQQRGGYGFGASPQFRPPMRRVGRISYGDYLARMHFRAWSQPERDRSDYQVRLLPLGGETPRDVASPLNGREESYRTVVAVNGAAFWTEGPEDGPPKYVDIWADSAGRKLYITGPPAFRATLMSCSVVGGPARTVLRGVPRRFVPNPLGDGISWVDPSSVPRIPYENRTERPTWFEDRVWVAADGSVTRHLRHIPVSGREVVVGDCLCCLASPGPGPTGELDVVSFELRTGARTQWQIQLPQGSKIESVFSDGRGLFALTFQGEYGDPHRRARIVRLPLGPAQTVQTLAEVPESAHSAWAADGAIYFNVTEAHENWFDWSAAGLMQNTQTVLYRVRLPR